jgi:hypothetical protein
MQIINDKFAALDDRLNVLVSYKGSRNSQFLALFDYTNSCHYINHLSLSFHFNLVKQTYHNYYRSKVKVGILFLIVSEISNYMSAI